MEKIVKMRDETEDRLARAALAVFRRDGPKQTRMERIAAEAGLSKPTLYARFPSKDAALAGAIRLAQAEALRALEQAWSGAGDVPQKLDIFFDLLVLAGFDILHDAPDPAAFETALGAQSRAAIIASRTAQCAVLQRLFHEAGPGQPDGGGAQDLAEFVVTSALNAKRLAPDRAALERYLSVLKRATLGLLHG